MKAMRFSSLGLVVLVLAVTQGMAQNPGGSGRRFGSMDPNDLFNQMANGKEVLVRSDIADPRMQGMFDRIAERMGVTNGQITREQFTAYSAQRTAERAARNGAPGGSAPPTAPGAAPASTDSQPANGPDAWAGWAESMFRRYDLNGDGYLNNDELPEGLASERDKWDTDHNGLIDLNEFKAYFVARMQQRLADEAANLGAPPGDPGAAAPALVLPPDEDERKPVVVFRMGKLPKELPAWFQQLDTDQDAQIGLYEWRASGRPISEFQEIDRNNDGFLTVQEVLAYEAKKKTAPSSPTVVATVGDSGQVAPGSPPAGPGRSSPGGFSRRRQRDR